MDTIFPEILITYLSHFRQAFSSTSYPYFQGAYALCCSLRGESASPGWRVLICFFDKSLSSGERCLSDSQWNLDTVIHRLISLCCTELGEALLYANRYIIAIDTLLVQKVFGKMSGVQKWHQSPTSTAKQDSIIGHHWAICGLLAPIKEKWHRFPIATRLISGQKCASHFVSGTDGVAHKMCFFETVRALVTCVSASITAAPVCVVADAYFANPSFLMPSRTRALVW